MEAFTTPIAAGANIYDLQLEIGKKVATDWLKRPLRKKDLVCIHDVAAGHSVYYNGILLGCIKEVDDGLLFEPHNPNYGFHSISKGGY